MDEKLRDTTDYSSQSLQEKIFTDRLKPLGYTCETTCSDAFTTIRFIPIEDSNEKQEAIPHPA